jgi:hypothetical protein
MLRMASRVLTLVLCSAIYVVHNPSYPGIRENYRRTFRILESLHPDIFLAAHASFFDFERKRRQPTVGAFVNPDRYRTLIAAKKAAFERLAAEEAQAR